MNGISLADIESAALRSLLGCRGLSKAGFGINGTTNTYTVTVGGTIHTDDVLTVNVLTDAGLVTGSFTVTGTEDTLAKAATALELVVEALTGVSSSATDEVITITPTTTTQAITVTVEVTGTDATTTLTAEQTIIGSKGIATANTLNFLMNGHTGQIAATDNIEVLGTTLPVSSYRWYLLTVNGAGTFVAHPQTDNVNSLPEIPADTAPVGALKIATSATVPFVPGTTSLNLTGITTTFFDLSCVPKAGYPA